MKFRRFASMAVLAGLLATPVFAATNPRPQDKDDKKEAQGRERHPAIRAAIQALERAKYDLEHADHDFGGHRAEALESVNNAIKQLRVALQYDKK